MENEQIEHLINLAKLDLSEREKEKLKADLSEILDYVEKLKEVDVSNVEPMTGGTFLNNRYVEDKPCEDLRETRELHDAFPEKEKGYLKVPKIIEK